ncbi:DUF1801 domain-containing protein [Flavobacterium sp.]|uniref:YdeI/OmpD-associated family protein n=1 Tax=Flavobacterium sp. TaxID=239 RepID=UPI002627AA74|nr:DUF1801 domain-containing protein [Flavobacterium sp.]
MEQESKHRWDKTNRWGEELERLKEILIQTQLVETTKWGAEVYTFNNKNVVGIGGFKNYFAIWFFNGVFLKDPKKVLVNAQEGVTKSLRQWRLYSKDEIDEKAILSYVNEAIENEKLGKKLAPAKKEAIISDFFQNQLIADLELKKSFEKLTPGKQREYLEYIDTAKREETKITRMEKIKPMILSGIGLNDKYK